ncbi:Integral membrane protein [Colletotrichum higginsianum IMI 349063]|uniref:Integral membrane protein n=1 Tax=Colletotrichum higginsianum (strain IMI 349063) TaxID=759273 RepID=A0A1B7YG48_COLHI|nr:Integral membrane protein [Colletotrichum higginsianum IMI 349063]OBR10768.1 Integral membrane protein [Colletotrichum higginsianum IMI 349063]
MVAVGRVTAYELGPPPGLDVTAVLLAMPTCAKRPVRQAPTVATELAAANCSLTDINLFADCLCTNITLQSRMSTSVQTSCKFGDQLSKRLIPLSPLLTSAEGTFADSVLEVVELETALCAAYPKESRVNEIRIASIVGLALTLPIVLGRCVCRYQMTNNLWWDDWMTIIATVDPGNEPALLQVWSSPPVQAQYHDVANINTVFAKVAIVMLYLRVFTTPWFKWACWAFVAFMFGHGAIFSLLIVFQCIPVAAVWDRFLSSRCLNVNAVGWAGAVLSIIEDIVLMILPIPELMKLQITGRKRTGVGIMFSIASFATVTSMIRLKYLVQFSNTYDTTWDNVDIVVWSIIEEMCAIICGSLPPLRPWFSPFIPSIRVTWKSTKFSKNNSRSTSNTARDSTLRSASKGAPGQDSRSAHLDYDPDSKDFSYPLSSLSQFHQSPGKAGGYPRVASSRDIETASFPDGVAEKSSTGNSSGSETNLVIQGNNDVSVTFDVDVVRESRSKLPGGNLGRTVSVISAGHQPR